MASTVLRRATQDADLEEVKRRLNTLLDIVNGNIAGRIKLRNDDGIALSTIGTSVSSGNYALDVKAASGLHGVFTHSTGSPVILAITDSGGVTASTVNAGATGITGSLTFVGAARRILGDFTNATASDRVLVQTTTANSPTYLSLIPSGSGTIGYLSVFNNAAPASASVEGMLRVNGTSTQLRSESPSGSYQPLDLYTNATQNARLATTGVFSATAMVAGSATGTLVGTEELRVIGQTRLEGDTAVTTGALTVPATDPPTANTEVTAGSQAKAWAHFTVSGGALTFRDSYNVDTTNCTYNAAGDYSIVWDRNFSSAYYAVVVTVEDNGAVVLAPKINGQIAGSADVWVYNAAATKTDPDAVSVIAFGTLS